MTNKKKRSKYARAFRKKGFPWRDSHRLAKIMVNNYFNSWVLEDKGFRSELVMTCECCGPTSIIVWDSKGRSHYLDYFVPVSI